MKFDRSDAFKADWKRLSDSEKALFRAAVPVFAPAAAAYVQDHAPFPASLRVKDVRGAAGVHETTWSFSGPDGRATWEWVQLDGETAVRWRRIGGHAVSDHP